MLVAFIECHQPKKYSTEKNQQASKETPALDKERDSRERTYRKKSLLLCTVQLLPIFFSRAHFFRLQKEMQVGKIGVANNQSD
jgi:hypothetical protein